MLVYKYPEPKDHGSVKAEEAFAIFPKRLDDGNVVWLEFYLVDYKYLEYKIRDSPGDIPREAGWIKIKSYRINKNK